MTQHFFTPGPSQIHPAAREGLKQAMADDIGSISHRSKQFERIFSDTCSSLRAIMEIPASHSIFFLGSATEGMERIVQNCVTTGSFHFVNGEFSKRFYQVSQELQRNPEKVEARPGEGFDLSSSTVPERSDLVCLTQNETSTGVWLPESEITALKKRFPERLFAVDIVSSAPVSRLDFNLIDCAFFSVQKCFGLPAGLGILIVNQKCLDTARRLSEKGKSTGSYHSFAALFEYAAKNQTPETPNVLGIYLLGKVAADFKSAGIEEVRSKVRKNAARIYGFFENSHEFRPFVRDEKFRSPTVITIETGPRTKDLLSRFSASGITVGGGYGPFKETQIRIANFPANSDEEVSLLLEKAEEAIR